MNISKKTNILLFLYIFTLTFLILFKLSLDIPSLVTTRSINLIPFYYDKETTFHLKEIIENILIFIPLGLLLKMKDLSFQKIFLLGFLLSFTYEFLQYIFSIGVADITDIITNAIGAILGSLVYSILSHFIHNKSKLNNFIITSGYLVFTIFIALFALLNIVN